MNYKHIYLCIIRKAKNEQNTHLRPISSYDKKINFGNQYYEFHHILPKSLFKQFKNVKKNVIALTAKEHFICHKLLLKIYPSREMSYALLRMCNKRKDMHNVVISSMEYERIRLCVSKYQSEYMKNHTITDEQKFKTSETLKKKYNSGEYIPHNKNNNLSLDTRTKISDTLKEKYKTGEIEVWNKNSKCPKSIKLKDDNGMYGKHWYTDGKINIVAEKCPNGFHKGNTRNIDKDIERKRKEKISKSLIGKHWFNNGKINKFCYECPDGFVKGFLNTRWSKND